MKSSLLLRFLVFLALSTLSLSSAHAERSPNALLDLARAGVPMLALSIMDRQQPRREAKPHEWVSWERVRLAILWDAGRYSELVKRAQALSDDMPPEFLVWARTQEARAQIKLGQGKAARAILRALIWQGAASDTRETLGVWQRLVIESYLIDDLLQDAQTSLLRYEQDYGVQSEQERLLRARVFIRLNEPERVAQALKGATSSEAMALSLMAQLQHSKVNTKAVGLEALKLVGKKDLKAHDRARLWYVAALAAARGRDRIKQVNYLEQALAAGRYLDASDRIFRFDGDDLWAAYIALGQQQGNRAQLLVGDDAQWLKAAASMQKKQPYVARAYYAVVASAGTDAKRRNGAHQHLVEALLEEENGAAIVDALYMNNQRYAQVDSVPLPIRYVLANHALKRGEIPLASLLMGALSHAPEGVDAFAWQLRRARIHILGGHEEEGIDILYTLLGQSRSLDKEAADRFMQVVFDLQTVKRHEAAINLFVALQPRLSDAQQQREILFWQADSAKALGKYEQAAWLYMESAILKDPYAMDPWAQTCRFHAANTLVDAGLTQDARHLLEQLLSVTVDEQRRGVLRQKLQQLQLKE